MMCTETELSTWCVLSTKYVLAELVLASSP